MNLKRVRYKQRDFSLDDIDELKQINWNLEKYGCGPTSIANVLVLSLIHISEPTRP